MLPEKVDPSKRLARRRKCAISADEGGPTTVCLQSISV